MYFTWNSVACWLDIDGCFGYLQTKEKYTLNFLCPCANGRCAIRKLAPVSTGALKGENICQFLVDLWALFYHSHPQEPLMEEKKLSWAFCCLDWVKRNKWTHYIIAKAKAILKPLDTNKHSATLISPSTVTQSTAPDWCPGQTKRLDVKEQLNKHLWL